MGSAPTSCSVTHPRASRPSPGVQRPGHASLSSGFTPRKPHRGSQGAPGTVPRRGRLRVSSRLFLPALQAQVCTHDACAFGNGGVRALWLWDSVSPPHLRRAPAARNQVAPEPRQPCVPFPSCSFCAVSAPCRPGARPSPGPGGHPELPGF